MNDEQNSEVILGDYPTEMDLHFKKLGLELHKGSLPYLRDALYKLAVLDATLIGGSVVFLKDDNLRPSARFLVVLVFLLSLAVSLVGMMPLSLGTTLQCPDEIRENIEKAVRAKTGFLRIAAFLICLGFIIALLGMIQ